MQKHKLLYSGKVKSLYATDDPDYLIMEFRNEATAYNDPTLTKQLAGKGAVNNQVNAFIMQQLAQAGVPVHFDKLLNDTASLVKHLQMIPLESVLRNIAAGTVCKRLGIEEGRVFKQPILEFCYKDDKLGDPIVHEAHILEMGWSDQQTIDAMKKLTLKVNHVLTQLFDRAGFILVDFKLEFGYFKQQLLLGDEFTLDSCRIWDKQTKEKFDKDRFRRGLGSVIEYYTKAAERIGVILHA